MQYNYYFESVLHRYIQLINLFKGGNQRPIGRQYLVGRSTICASLPFVFAAIHEALKDEYLNVSNIKCYLHMSFL